MEINLMELWSEMGLPVKTVVIVLTLQAIGCITVMIDRLLALYQSNKRAQQFAALAGPAMQSGQYDEVLRSISDVEPSHLTKFLDVGIRTFLGRRHAGDDAERAAELTRRALERKGDAISRDLNRGMNVIASTGSTAPFVGLLGTVLGIINAFKMIAADGSGGIGTIGAAIGEALIVTGYGLMVAIPSVLLFNMLSSMIAKYEAGLLNAGSELVDQLETATALPSAEALAQPAAAPQLANQSAETPVAQQPAAEQPAYQVSQSGYAPAPQQQPAAAPQSQVPSHAPAQPAASGVPHRPVPRLPDSLRPRASAPQPATVPAPGRRTWSAR
ncbi:MAG: MotA/TolQ/ExbB proton channel family protein [Myxococcales bacterium]|jgi:biopolymer transport protein ExbB/TolQ